MTSKQVKANKCIEIELLKSETGTIKLLKSTTGKKQRL